jgi:hypothetical protein
MLCTHIVLNIHTFLLYDSHRRTLYLPHQDKKCPAYPLPREPFVASSTGASNAPYPNPYVHDHLLNVQADE